MVEPRSNLLRNYWLLHYVESNVSIIYSVVKVLYSSQIITRIYLVNTVSSFVINETEFLNRDGNVSFERPLSEGTPRSHVEVALRSTSIGRGEPDEKPPL